MAKPEEFFKKYHIAVARANKSQLDKLKPRIASEWVNEWMEQVGGSIADPEEFSVKFQEFLTEGLGFADDSKVSVKGDELTIDVGGCIICPGNDVLKKAGEEALCPITPTGLMAISRVMGKKATLLGVDKEGKPVGYCQIKYKLEEKPA
ncbi:MAG TPA: hypothetical protein VIK02_02980 [Candidatus Anoxymicrobiaceae bacterium]|jgi:hypothetical protein